MTDLAEVTAVWRGEVSQALKSGRVVALLALYLLFTTLALAGTGYVNMRLNNEVSADKLGPGVTQEQAQEALTAQKKQALDVLYDEPMLSALLPLPLVLLIVFKLAMLFVPLFVALMGFDQISGEVGPRSIRYLVVRVKRSSLLLGKFLAQASVYALLVAACVVLMSVVAKALNADFGFGDAFLWLFRLLLAALAFGLAYLGLTSLCSSLVRTPAISMILNVIGLFVLWVVAFVGESLFLMPGEKAAAGTLSSLLKSESAWAYTRYLSVWHFEPSLLHPEWTSSVPALLVHLGFALTCLGLASLVLKARDV